MTEKTLLIIDDEPANLALLSRLLQPHYRVKAAARATHALKILDAPPPPDLILLDVMMPDMDGHELLRHIRAQPSLEGIPVIFVTAMDEETDEQKGFALGAVDYIIKPIRPAIVLARIAAQLELKEARDRLRHQNLWLEQEVERRMRENDLIQLVGIRALAHLAEIRDPETGNHILRTQGYVEHLALLLAQQPDPPAELDADYIRLLTRSAPLHDVGKIGIPDAILLKPGPLTAEEWVIMQTHTRLGADAIDLAEADVEQSIPFLQLAKEIAHYHHERWDGSGYPDGLKGSDIPLSARLMALADVFDALISPRVYKPPMEYSAAREIIASGCDQQFDPRLCQLFLDHYDDFIDIAETYSELKE